jgi:hypothetical protein
VLISFVYSKSNPRLFDALPRVASVFSRCSANPQALQPANEPGSNSFPHTSLAAPHPVTPIESHPYKNGRGAGCLPSPSRSASHNPGAPPHSPNTLAQLPSPLKSTTCLGQLQVTGLANPDSPGVFDLRSLISDHSPPPSVPLHPTSLGATMANGTRFLHHPGKQLRSPRCLRIVSGHREPFDDVPGHTPAWPGSQVVPGSIVLGAGFRVCTYQP